MNANAPSQSSLPLEEAPPDGRVFLNASVWFIDSDGYRVVFRWHEPMYRIALDDEVHLRLVAVALRQSGLDRNLANCWHCEQDRRDDRVCRAQTARQWGSKQDCPVGGVLSTSPAKARSGGQREVCQEPAEKVARRAAVEAASRGTAIFTLHRVVVQHR